jgi:hypothetical protein
LIFFCFQGPKNRRKHFQQIWTSDGDFFSFNMLDKQNEIELKQSWLT